MQHLYLSFDDLTAHRIHAKLVLTLHHAQKLILQLPRWIPGSYLVRDFAKHLSIHSAVDQLGNLHKLDRIDLARWEIMAPAGMMTIKYEVYAFDSSVRANYLCEAYAFINPTACALYVEDWRNKPYQITLIENARKSDWKVHTQLPAKLTDTNGFGHYTAQTYDELIEHPILIAQGITINFNAQGIEHRMILVDEAPLEFIDSEKLAQDLTAICETELLFWQQKTLFTPFESYLFIVMVSPDGYGGLEHTNSTALMTSRRSLPRLNQVPNSSYQDFLGLCAHEYFHVWLVKRIKPQELIQPHLNEAIITSLLWVFEGITSLYDDWMLLRSQRIKQSELLSRWSDSLTRTLTSSGGSIQSLADASREAWIKFYQPNENSANTQVSYYTRGMATSLLLLCELHQHQIHLDQLLQLWWQQWLEYPNKGLTNEGLINDLTNLCPHVNWSSWLAEHIESPNPQLAEQLALRLPSLGLVLMPKTQPSLGVKLAQEAHSLIVKSITTSSPAHVAGWQVGDELIALNGWRMRTQAEVDDQLAHWHAQPTLDCLTATLARKDKIIARPIQPNLMTHAYELNALDQTSLNWLTP